MHFWTVRFISLIFKVGPEAVLIYKCLFFCAVICFQAQSNDKHPCISIAKMADEGVPRRSASVNDLVDESAVSFRNELVRVNIESNRMRTS